MPRRSVPALSLAAALAAALTGACNDGPLGPNTSTRPAASRGAVAPAPSAVPPGMIHAAIWIYPEGVAKQWGNYLPGTTVRFSTDKGVVDVVDNGPGDRQSTPGLYHIYLPAGSTFYKAEVVGAPVGYQLPTSPTYATVVKGGLNPDYLVFGNDGVTLSAKKQLRVNFVDKQTRKPVAGGTVVVTAPGLDLIWTLTDGGAGDLTPLGAQGPADGQVTVYAPIKAISTWKVCEQTPPSGYLLTEPACVTMNVPATEMTNTVTLFHQTGIIAPPPM